MPDARVLMVEGKIGVEGFQVPGCLKAAVANLSDPTDHRLKGPGAEWSSKVLTSK